ncbi:ribonuclease H-like domain-containing protein [Artemisia annua]|uniref:Ribonuclease H-like domain-containing protein n=1 Tax=Artemisia annua TaxID=35608 RepID=A0A2U1PNE7_ARTAN|nr:ribonuclease H-like domain-containing protein [Artemisia annua]
MSGDGSSGSELAIQLANILKTNINQQPQNPKLSDNLQINLKLNNQNYALWTRMIRVAIGGKSKNLLTHLTKEPLEETNELFETWEQDDLVVFSWLIQNIEPTIAGNLTEYPTAKTLWDALATTYSSRRDKLQVFNLHVKTNELKQNEKSLEEFWIALQGVWGEIDRIDPNPMSCAEDIKKYSKVRSEQKLFQFLHGLDRKFDPIKREILRLDPLPSAETAYATVRKEAAHQSILGATNSENQGIASGFHVRIVGYPDWWNDGHKRGTRNPKSEKEKIGAPTAQASTSNKEETGKGFGGLAALAAAGNGEKGDEFVVTEGCPTHSTTPLEASSQYSPSPISATQNISPNLVSEVSSSQPIDSQNNNSHELVESTSNAEPEQQETTNQSSQDHTEPVLEEVPSSQDHTEPVLEEVPSKYTLPPRANRGVPAKRFSPEKISRSSKYPIANMAEGNLSKEAKAFTASLYSEKVPSNLIGFLV